MRLTFFAFVALTALGSSQSAALAARDSSSKTTVCDAVWFDAARSRSVRVRLRMPLGTGSVPLILFSHGLGGDLDAGTFWADAWAADGNAVLNLQHEGSDRTVIRSGHLRQAISVEQVRARSLDVRFAIDEVARRPREGACDLRRIDLARVGMSGHSYGAQTTLSVSGQVYPLAGMKLGDPRVKAAVALSPQPAVAQPDTIAFGSIAIPFLSVTGTKDVVGWLNEVTAKDRERPYRAMPPGEKYLLVLDGANHRMFSGQDNIPLPDSAPTDHVRDEVIRVTILFWRATLRGDSGARAKLADLGASIATGDRYEHR